jgi:hypothetical protein
MNEAKMTDADMKQREKIVKSMKNSFKDFRRRYGADAKNVMYATATKMAMKEDLQGSSVAKVPYRELDMDNLVQDAIKDIPEDDGPHTSSIGDMDAINFQTVAKPEDVVNQPNNEGNRESTAVTSTRKTGKPFKAIRSRGPGSYGAEDLSGAVASVAIGEAVKDEADKGEYDYEGDMAKSSLRTIIRNAEMMHDMLGEDTNLPEWVQSKITLAEDYLVSAAQYMQSEMSEEVELDEGKWDYPKQLTQTKTTSQTGSTNAADNRARRKAFRKKVKAAAHKKLMSGMKNEEVELDEISSYTASRAADKSWFQGNHHAATNHRFNDRKLRTVAGDGSKRADGKLGDKSHAKAKSQLKKFQDYARKRRNQELVAKHPNLANEPRYQDRNPRERTEEYNPTPFRNTERGVRGSKPNGQLRGTNSRQFFRPPEGFTKKGIEKGGGIKTMYHYKGKSNTPSGATMKMGGVTVPMGKTPTKRRVKEELGLEENKYSLPAGSTMKGNAPVKPKSYLEKRFGHLKPGESASLKGDPKKVMNKTNEEQEQQVETPNGSNN